jgi:beta-glucosidase
MMNNNKILRVGIAAFGALLIWGAETVASERTILSDMNLDDVDHQVDELVAQMTLDEKMQIMHGDPARHYGGTPAISRLGIPRFVISHGPYGMRGPRWNEEKKRWDHVHGTFMSASMNYAASWDPELVERVAVGVGKEVRAIDNHLNAGPAFNIIRDLRGGRSTEYYTEDPYLNARTTVAFVKGQQSQDVVAILKHYACNNQEQARPIIDVNVSKRALHEIYLPAFEYAVKEADAMSVMSSYNKINGKWAAENPYLLTDVLRGRWGFKGCIISDWNGTHSTEDSVNAGLDWEMPRALWYGDKLKQAVLDGTVSEELIDERVSNTLRAMFAAKRFEADYKNPPFETVRSPEMIALAEELALNSIVLLKNENSFLPLDQAAVKSVAVIGPAGDFGPHYNNGNYDYTLHQCGGSAHVNPGNDGMVTPFEGLRNYLGDGVEVKFAHGVYADNGCGPIDGKYFKTQEGKAGLAATYFSGSDFKTVEREAVDPTVNFKWTKDPTIPEAGRNMDRDKRFGVRWEGRMTAPVSRVYTFECRFDGTATVWIDGRQVFRENGNGDIWWHQFKTGLTEGPHDIKIEYQKAAGSSIMKFFWDYENDAWMKEAVELAQHSDVVVLAVGNSGNIEGEGKDRFRGLQLRECQQDLINAVASVNPNAVVVTFTAGVGMEGWIKNVPAVFGAMYPGEQAGSALAKLIFGEANPSGKLPVTIPKDVSQYPEGNYIGGTRHIDYKEGVFVGYRHFDQNNIDPQFPFGYGLSYTGFEYGSPEVSRGGGHVIVKMDITNTGKHRGAEVVQLYVKDVECSVPRPPKELKSFEKVWLDPGETKTVSFELNDRAFAFFDEAKDDWTVEPGEFELLIGSSSRDIRGVVNVTVK